MKKRLIALIFAFCMLINFSFVVSANELYTETKTVKDFISKTAAQGYVNTNAKMPDGSAAYTIDFTNTNESVDLEFNIPKDGYYKVTAYAAGYSQPERTMGIEVYLKDGSEYVKTLVLSGITNRTGLENVLEHDMGSMYLEAGTVVLRAENGTAWPLRFSALKLTEIPALEISSITANGVAFEENGTVARGADSFIITLNQAFQADTVSADTVYIMGNEKVNADASVSEGVIILKLNETLDFATDYTLYINGVESDSGAADDTFAFSTVAEDGADSGEAALSQPNILLSGGVVKAEGIMYGSAGQVISGREAHLYITDPEGNGADVIAATDITDAEGKYTLEYALDENAPSGEYTITIGGEYIEEADRKSGTSRFVSPQAETQIISGLETAADSAAAKMCIEAYAAALDINPSVETGGDLEGLENVDIIFANLAGKTFASAGEVRTAYYAEVLTAKINEADENSDVDAILSDADNCVLLGIDTDKREAVVSAYESLVADVLALDAQTDAAAMKVQLNKLLDKALVEEYGLVSAEMSADDSDLYESQTLILPLSFTAMQMYVKAVKFEITSDLIGMNNVTFEDADGVDAEVSVDGKTATVTFESSDVINSITTVGNLKIANTQKGTADVTINGVVTMSVNGLDIPVDTIEKNVTVTVHPKKYGFVYEDASVSGLNYVLSDRTTWSCRDSVQTTGGVDYIGFHSGEWHEFEVEVPKTGNYHFVIVAGIGSQTYSPKVSITGAFESESAYKDIVNGVMSYTGAWTTFKEHYIGTATLSEGTYKIKVSNTYADAYFAGMKVISATDLGVRDIKVGDTSLLVADTAKRGSDVIEITFIANINADTVSEGSVTISDEEGILACDVVASDNKATLILKETLDYEKAYTIKINGVADVYNASSIKNKLFTFTTLSEGDDEGNASITGLKGQMIYETATVKGTLLGSNGQIMAGREVSLYIKDTSGNLSDAVASAITDENGNFEITYSIDASSPAGVYTYIFESDYIAENERAEFNLTYVTREQGDVFLDLLKTTETASDVLTLLESNESMLMIDVSADVAELEDANSFYNLFAGIELSDIPAFFDFYEKALVVEKINQADEAAEIELILADEENLELLGIEKARYDLLVNKKDTFIQKVCDLIAIADVDDLIEKVNELFEETLADEYEKPDSEASSESTTIYTGYSAAIKLGLTEAVVDAQKVEFIVESANSDLLAEIQLKDVQKGEISYTLETANRLRVTFEPERPDRELSYVATLYLATANETGTNTLKISGSVTYPIPETEEVVLASITEKTITVKVNASAGNNSDSVAEGGSTRVPSGSNRGSGSSSVVVPDTGTTEKTEDGETQDAPFTDLGSVAWAEGSILKLHELGIVSDSSDKKFNPNNAVKKEELVKMLVLALELELKGESTLNDVNKDAWYYQYVAASQYHGLILGDDLGNFGIGTNLSRQDLCVIIARAISNGDYSSGAAQVTFADDSEIAGYAKEAVYWLKANNMIDGVGDNKFAPKEPVTRAMAAKLIASVLSFENGEVK